MQANADTLGAIVAIAAARFGNRRALTTPAGWSLTYAQLDLFADEAAAGLAKRGVGAGDVVALVLPSGCEYAVLYVALARLGAITVGVNPVLARAERRVAVDVVGPKLVIASTTFASGLPPECTAEIELATSPHSVLTGLRMRTATSFVPRVAGIDQPVAIVLTSGTTGRPKGAVFTPRQINAVTRYDLGEHGAQQWGGGTAMLAGTQFAHVGFMTKFAWYVRTGVELMLLDRWRAADVLDIVEATRMPVIGGVAPQIALMLRDERFDQRDLSSVQALIVGGAPSPPALVIEARTRFDAAYSIRYSSTESGGVGTGTAFDAPDAEALHTVGRPRDGMGLAIRDEDGRDLATGEVGEVCLRSDASMVGYWDNPEATARAVRNGWLHTGDLGSLDGSGCLSLVGRDSEMFLRGGENVYPVQVEAVLAAHPKVREVAVVPRADDVMGNRGVAVVVPNDAANPPTLEDLRSFAADDLARFKLPEDLVLTDALPLTSGQKLDRRVLGTLVAEASEDGVT